MSIGFPTEDPTFKSWQMRRFIEKAQYLLVYTVEGTSSAPFCPSGGTLCCGPVISWNFVLGHTPYPIDIIVLQFFGYNLFTGERGGPTDKALGF